MDKEYKEWLQDQTFKTLATDNYNVKLLLLAEQTKNKKLVEALENVNKKFPIDDKYIFKNDIENICRILFAIRDVTQQALNEVNK